MLRTCVPPAEATVESVNVNVPVTGLAPDVLQTASVPVGGGVKAPGGGEGGGLPTAGATHAVAAATASANAIHRPPGRIRELRIGPPGGALAVRLSWALPTMGDGRCRRTKVRQRAGACLPRDVSLRLHGEPSCGQPPAAPRGDDSAATRGRWARRRPRCDRARRPADLALRRPHPARAAGLAAVDSDAAEGRGARR